MKLRRESASGTCLSSTRRSTVGAKRLFSEAAKVTSLAQTGEVTASGLSRNMTVSACAISAWMRCQSASDRDPRSASNRDPFVLRFERISARLVGAGRGCGDGTSAGHPILSNLAYSIRFASSAYFSVLVCMLRWRASKWSDSGNSTLGTMPSHCCAICCQKGLFVGLRVGTILIWLGDRVPNTPLVSLTLRQNAQGNCSPKEGDRSAFPNDDQR